MLAVLSRYLEPKAPIPRRVAALTSAATALLVLTVWCLLSYTGYVRNIFLPTPDDVVRTAYATVITGEFFQHLKASVIVILSGFVLASVISVPLGILMGSFRLIEAAVEPVTNFMRYLPVTALIPLLILWIGVGIEQRIAVIFLGTVFQQLILISDVSARVQRELVDMSYTLGATRRQVVRRVLVPAALPGVMDTLRVTMGWAWTFLVVAELVAANEGLGYMILNAMRGLYTGKIFLGILTIGILGLITDQVLKSLKRKLLPWATGL